MNQNTYQTKQDEPQPASCVEGAPSFSLSNRIERVIWGLCWSLFAAWTPAPMHRYRIWLLRRFGARVHASAHVYGSCRIWLPRNLEMGAYACLGPRVNCYSMGAITLGERAVVSQDATLCAGTHDPEDADFRLITKPIVIEEGAWIAAEAFVGPGITVGSKAILGARSVTFKDLEPEGVFVGNPATFIRARSLSKGPDA